MDDTRILSPPTPVDSVDFFRRERSFYFRVCLGNYYFTTKLLQRIFFGFLRLCSWEGRRFRNGENPKDREIESVHGRRVICTRCRPGLFLARLFQIFVLFSVIFSKAIQIHRQNSLGEHVREGFIFRQCANLAFE